MTEESDVRPPRPPEMPMKPGTRLGEGIEIERYLGRSEGGLSYLGRHPSGMSVVVKSLAPALEELVPALQDELVSLCALDHPSLQRVFPVVEQDGRPLFVSEYVEGTTLRGAVAQVAERGGDFGFRPAYNVLGHIAAALDELHTVSPHGVLTANNVFVEANGRVRIANIGFGRLMLAGLGGDSDAFRDTASIAPEVRADPWDISEVSDFYSLGVLAVHLWTGQEPTAASLPHLIEALEEKYVPEIGQLLRSLVADESVMRIATSAELHAELAALLRAVRLAGRSGEPIPGPESVERGAAQRATDDDLGSLFDGIELPDAPGGGEGGGGGDRWIVQRAGRDYGPYGSEQVLRQLHADEIDEYTAILDTHTREVQDLIDIPEFSDAVKAYIPQREARLEAERERREELQRTAKRAGVTTFVSLFVLAPLLLLGLVAFLVFGLGQGAYLFVQPDPYPFASVMRPFPYTFEVEAPEYETIAADPDLLASLRDFSEPEPTRRRGRTRSGAAAGTAGPEEESVEDFVLDFDSSRPARRLSQDEINGTLRASLGSFQRCFEPELRANPGFRGATLNFSIHPNGRPFNVSVEGARVSASLNTCLTSAVRRLRFPQYNDVPMSVRYPFVLQ
ncbi:MAG: hypothetical protein EA398_12060 [Deltaproteobacteria bacterium]|nr:MAG: hypothetical protein EA398_12060 [Deltaproteobacteria bacterium]